MPNIIIVGQVGVGKSTLINKVLENINLDVGGFETKKEDGMTTEDGTPVFIYKIGEEKHQSNENLIGLTGGKELVSHREVFDRYAEYIDNISNCDIIKFDELGFLETCSETFCNAIVRKLDGNIPVIAAVKPLEIQFLESIRNHPDSKVFTITENNREGLYNEVMDYIVSVIHL